MVTRSVLVIEDEAVVALFLSDILCDLNYKVCAVAASGREGLERAARHRPVLAMVAKHLDGLDTARELGARYGIPSILLSGDPAALMGARRKSVSPLAVLNKPDTPEQLEGALEDGFAQT